MKYFKIVDLTTMEEHFISSPLPTESPAHVALSAHLDLDHKYSITEVSAKEFYGFPPKCIDLEVDDDTPLYDDDDCECWD